MKLVSIVIPCHNAESTLARCLMAIQAQSYTHWEAWVINDGSSDQTKVVAEMAAAQDARIRVVNSLQNGGVSAARNQALDLAKGEYVAFCDADDQWDAQKLERQMQALQQQEANLCCTSFWFHNTQSGKVHRVDTAASINRHTMRFTNPIPLSTVMLHRSLLQQLRFPSLPEPYIHEDYAFWWGLFLTQSVKAINLQEPLATLYMNPRSRSANKALAARSHAYVLREFAGVKGLQLVLCMVTYAFYALKKRVSLN